MQSTPPPTLNGFLEQAWTEIVRGVNDARHGFHQPVVATVGPDGSPRSRMVVLRQADVKGRWLRFHTDTRASKVQELSRGVAWTFYDKGRRLQVRAFGPSGLADQARVDERWAASSAPSRKCYLVEPGPGTPLEAWSSGHDEWAGAVVPPLSRTEAGRAHFTVVETQVEQLEVLRVRREGHHRARYAWRDGSWQGTWVVP